MSLRRHKKSVRRTKEQQQRLSASPYISKELDTNNMKGMFQLDMDNLDLGISPDLLFANEDSTFATTQMGEAEMMLGMDESSYNTNMALDDDMFVATAKPSDVTGQSLATHMQDDKMQTLLQMSATTNADGGRNHQGVEGGQLVNPTDMWATSPMTQLDDTDRQDMTSPSIMETESLIQELEEFMNEYEAQNTPQMQPVAADNSIKTLEGDSWMNEHQTIETLDTSVCPIANSTLTDEETAAAEKLLDSLLMSGFDGQNLKDEGDVKPQTFTNTDDSGYQSLNVSGLTQIVSGDGQDVIIVVTPDETYNNEDAVRFQEITNTTNDKASSKKVLDLVNDCPKRKPGRKQETREKLTTTTTSTLRGVDKNKKRSNTIKDKKERKKMQNVEAARRYRDKKKGEQQLLEEEEEMLKLKNAKLTDRLTNIDSEVKTLKKLMLELGLVKFANLKTE